jgi:hypothetical protein
MQLVADDPVNRSIWTQSVELQRKIARLGTLPLRVGAQQAMPKGCDQELFSAQDPLPWVPDLVGSRFGSDPRSVLVVASSYNGFIEGYSRRDAVMPLANYVNAKNDDRHGLERFCRAFVEHVVDRDTDYYQPILRDLLPPAGCDPDCCYLTDFCKASFVQRGSGPDNGKRGDEGKDSVLEKYWSQWIPYVVGLPDCGGAAPLPYQWLSQRMQQCRAIVALGKIAEYGVLKIFQRMADTPKASSWKHSGVIPDHPTLTAGDSDWKYDYASSRRLKHWVKNEDWWVLSDSSSEARWFLLPVYHPSAAIGYNFDTEYRNTVPRVQRMLEERAKRL